MASVDQMVAFGRELLSREPQTNEDQLREYLLKEFLVDQDIESAFLRGGLWPMALLLWLFRGTAASREAKNRNSVEQAVETLRNQ